MTLESKLWHLNDNHNFCGIDDDDDDDDDDDYDDDDDDDDDCTG